jgi:hypothetical protein
VYVSNLDDFGGAMSTTHELQGVTIKAYSESTFGFQTTSEEIQVSKLMESDWSMQFALLVTALTGTDRLEVTCLFDAEEAYFISHDRQILPLSSQVWPPFPVGCILWVQIRGVLYQIDLPKYPYLKLSKQGHKVTTSFLLHDRFGSGLILWGDHKIKKSAVEKQLHIRVNRLRSLREAMWIEPYPNGARSVICLTDHPDFDTLPKLRLLYEMFSKNNFCITKGVFPGSDPMPGKGEPGLDVPEYKYYIDELYKSGSEIAYHGISPRTHPPSLPECLRRIEVMSRYSPKTWIDHGCGTYLFSKKAAFDEGADLVGTLSKYGIQNYWSYTDVWENPTRHLNVWKERVALGALTNFASFLWEKKQVNVPLMAYYGSSVLKNLFGPFHLRPIVSKPWKLSAWKLVAAHSRRLNYYHKNPMVLYDLNGQSSLMSNESIWVFDTVLLNHLAFQLRPANIDLLCKQNGLLLAHCYLGHHKDKGGTINCFAGNGTNVSLMPEFINDIQYISEKQRQREVVTLPFSALRNALVNFVNASLVRISSGWKIEGIAAIVASRQLTSTSAATQWCKEGLNYTEIKGESVLRLRS